MAYALMVNLELAGREEARSSRSPGTAIGREPQLITAFPNGSPLAQVGDWQLSGAPGAPPLSVPALDALLANNAGDDDFIWTGDGLEATGGALFGPNRLVLLMSNTAGLTATDAVNGVTGWGDVQIFEMQAGGADWQLPFDVDLSSRSSPRPGGPSSSARGYALARRTFFSQARNPDITIAKQYPALHAPTIIAKQGTYEHWYVANIGNSQPLDGSTEPDMHPFHIHLVNFVVTRRWDLNEQGTFVEQPLSDLNLDGIARQDTVMVPSNQLVELLVHYPAGYSGDYVYHCHLLEHEDKCMMSHFKVEA